MFIGEVIMRDIFNQTKEETKKSLFLTTVLSIVLAFIMWIFKPNSKILISFWVIVVIIMVVIIGCIFSYNFLNILLEKLKNSENINLNSENIIKNLEQQIAKKNYKEKIVDTRDMNGNIVFTFRSEKNEYVIGNMVSLFSKGDNKAEYYIGYGYIGNIQIGEHLIQVNVLAFDNDDILRGILKNEGNLRKNISLKSSIKKEYMESEHSWEMS